MIDTVRLEFSTLRVCELDALPIKSDRFGTNYSAVSKREPAIESLFGRAAESPVLIKSLNITDVKFGARLHLLMEQSPIQTPMFVLRSVEVSLPKILWGHNGFLISDQTQLDHAIQRLEAWISTISHEICEPVSRQLSYFFSRIDICWHFDVGMKILQAAHKGRKYPGIRAGFEDDRGTLICGGAGFRIQFYDKPKQMNARHRFKATSEGPCSRVEFQLHSRKVLQYFGVDGKNPRRIDFDRTVNVYRELLLKFDGQFKTFKSNGHKFAAFIAMIDTECPKMMCLERFLEFMNYSRQHEARFRKLFLSCRTEIKEFSWKSLLGDSGLPPAPDLFVNGELESPRRAGYGL